MSDLHAATQAQQAANSPWGSLSGALGCAQSAGAWSNAANSLQAQQSNMCGIANVLANAYANQTPQHTFPYPPVDSYPIPTWVSDMHAVLAESVAYARSLPPERRSFARSIVNLARRLFR